MAAVMERRGTHSPAFKKFQGDAPKPSLADCFKGMNFLNLGTSGGLNDKNIEKLRSMRKKLQKEINEEISEGDESGGSGTGSARALNLQSQEMQEKLDVIAAQVIGEQSAVSEENDAGSGTDFLEKYRQNFQKQQAQEARDPDETMDIQYEAMPAGRTLSYDELVSKRKELAQKIDLKKNSLSASDLVRERKGQGQGKSKSSLDGRTGIQFRQWMQSQHSKIGKKYCFSFISGKKGQEDAYVMSLARKKYPDKPVATVTLEKRGLEISVKQVEFSQKVRDLDKRRISTLQTH